MSARTKPVEGRAEQLAREMVARCLSAVVERYDDGTAPRMPDGLIYYPDGRRAGLEVVGDHDTDFERQNAALADQRRIRIDGLRWSWSLSVEHSTDIRSLRKVLPSRLRHAEENASGDAEQAARAFRAADDFDRLGVFSAQASAHRPGGLVTLTSAPFAGFGHGAEVLPAWVEAVLRREHDVSEKLAAAGLGNEGHAFIWVTIGTSVQIQTVLDGAARDLPTFPPQLPAGVTHVWVVSGFTSTRGLAWFPNGGWHELAFRWVDEQPLRLTQPR